MQQPSALASPTSIVRFDNPDPVTIFVYFGLAHEVKSFYLNKSAARLPKRIDNYNFITAVRVLQKASIAATLLPFP